MTPKSLVEKRSSQQAGFMDQQLGFDAMNTGRLLKSLDDVREQPAFDDVRFGNALAIGHEQVTDDPLAAFVDKEGVSEDAATIDRRIARQDFRVNVPQDHV